MGRSMAETIKSTGGSAEEREWRRVDGQRLRLSVLKAGITLKTASGKTRMVNCALMNQKLQRVAKNCSFCFIWNTSFHFVLLCSLNVMD
jgi:hypothetical protein